MDDGLLGGHERRRGVRRLGAQRHLCGALASLVERCQARPHRVDPARGAHVCEERVDGGERVGARGLVQRRVASVVAARRVGAELEQCAHARHMILVRRHLQRRHPVVIGRIGLAARGADKLDARVCVRGRGREDGSRAIALGNGRRGAVLEKQRDSLLVAAQRRHEERGAAVGRARGVDRLAGREQLSQLLLVAHRGRIVESFRGSHPQSFSGAAESL